MTSVQSSKENIKDFLRDNNEYFIRMLAEYTEKDVKEDGVLTIELHCFDPQFNKTFKFRLDELSDKVEEYKKRQLDVREQFG